MNFVSRLLYWLCCWNTVTAFCALSGLQAVSKIQQTQGILEPTYKKSVQRTRTSLKLSDDENSMNNETQEEVQKKSETKFASEAIDEKSPKIIVRNIWEGINYLYSFFIIGIGGALSIGLLLNLSGYAYSFSAKEGLRIDTLDEIRMERQLQQVSKVVPENAASSPVSAVGNFFMRRPFAASLLVTGAVLFLEEIKGPEQKRDP
mmetsp:Transcript_5613/g.8634  ORF Transcript_5613/g.8634 Transcript_5613/m.8634 type:complete len:204 (+) Transcript_5613:275-886(+)|eukprot:CAMPEP_0178931984 /NCGR_PEP_ID=MMETSP0786-20121207/22285_1 /TAXON_ID=186022 /ORGANISM="Thalassionema frauenfeldii, Strain CCMP 1798" /LENGTH=203 /DNA_ID=CAMNT_0020609065 /DNA_START=220 /DNA_END=831 /DNA_ORIENTATION=-